MACMTHMCHDCDLEFMNNHPFGQCPECGRSTGKGQWDEVEYPEEESDDCSD